MLYMLSQIMMLLFTSLQERNAILNGRTELTITTYIGGGPTTLVLSSREGQSILFTSGKLNWL